MHIQLHSQKVDNALDEFRALVGAAGFLPVGELLAVRKTIDPRYFIGKGKVEEIQGHLAASGADLVIIGEALAPAQQRNLEKAFNCRVVDRTELILAIFARRAQSAEGKLQVELATLKHQSTRLVRGWTHLERQRGGIGLRGGPGETQLEVDRRQIRTRMRQVSERLEKVRRQRDLGRRLRQRAAIPTLALVGYTNAGKSTLFNRLTGAGVFTADQLFATLDPALRRAWLQTVGPVIFADTVGFIRDLPPDLVKAFRATLEEVTRADVLLHVVDLSDPDRQDHIADVQSVLEILGADTIPQVMVYNKLDRAPDASVVEDAVPPSVVVRVFVSALDKTGCDVLREALVSVLSSQNDAVS